MSENWFCNEGGSILVNNSHRFGIRLISLLVAVCCAIVGSFVPSQTVQAEVLPPASQPKLVLVLVVDQFSYDYLTRFADKLSPGGFRFLQQRGAFFTNCKYKQATTLTAVGHSVIASGAYPWSSGIVANEWYDRRRSTEIPAVYDEAVQPVGGSGAGASARALMGSTIGDELKLATNGRSRVFSVSIKDRSALFLAGKMANGAFWFDTRTGAFVTGSQFGATLPGWVKTFNDQHYADKYFGKAWQRLLPETEYSASTRDDYQYEGVLPGDGRQFPHVVTGGLTAVGDAFYHAFTVSPWANQMVCDVAKEAIEQEGLGQHPDADYLAVSFSSVDLVGHLYGPHSQEAEDTFLRLDQSLANFLQFVNAKVGLNKCVIAVTGDHGVLPIPELLKERGQARGIDSGRIDAKAFKTLLDSALDGRLGAQDWISSFCPPNLYLNLAAIDKEKYRQPEVEALAAKLAHSIPGIGDVYCASQLFSNQLPNGPYVDAVKKSYYWGRSGELYVIPRPGWIFSGEPVGTSHGTPYSYDTQVPLILFGTQIQGGKFGTDSSPADIAPTVSAILNINMPSLCEGRVLQEALGQVAGPQNALPPAGATR